MSRHFWIQNNDRDFWPLRLATSPSIQLSQFTCRIPRMPLVELILSLQYFHPLLTFPSPSFTPFLCHSPSSFLVDFSHCTFLSSLSLPLLVPVFSRHCSGYPDPCSSRCGSRRSLRVPVFSAVAVPGVPVHLPPRQLPAQAVCSSLRKVVLNILESRTHRHQFKILRNNWLPNNKNQILC